MCIRDREGVQFQYKVFLEVQLRFPRMLVNLLPVRLTRVNAWGSNALTKTVTQNGPPNLRRLYDAFQNYIEDNSRQ